MRADIPVGLHLLFITSLKSFRSRDCAGGLIVEMFDDSNKFGVDVLFHGCPQSCILNLLEGLLEVYEDMVAVLLVLEIFLTED